MVWLFGRGLLLTHWVEGGFNPEPILVKWEVSQDEAFTKIVQQGSVVAGPQLGHYIYMLNYTDLILTTGTIFVSMLEQR